MKLASAAFVVILLAAHAVGDRGERLAQPLSVFRDGEAAWLGYLLFAALVLVGVLYMRALIRAGEENEAISAGLAALLLIIVAVTPSLQLFHVLCSLLLLAFLFAHYWRMLRESGSAWIIAHTVTPLILIPLCGYHSYGLWQKSMILYLVALAAIRHHLLGREPSPSPKLRRRRSARKVYRLELGKAWARRKAG